MVVRKGATPAFPGQKGFIGGSMADDAVIVRGAERVPDETAAVQRASLYSTVHGAGRIMSRTAAKGKYVKDETGRKIRQEGRVRHDEMMKWLHEAGVTILDERHRREDRREQDDHHDDAGEEVGLVADLGAGDGEAAGEPTADEEPEEDGLGQRPEHAAPLAEEAHEIAAHQDPDGGEIAAH